jgi:hypothetical protein
MIAPRRICKVLGVLLIAGAVILAAVFLATPPSSPLQVMSCDSRFGITVRCTFGTNHVYYYGDLVDRITDPVIRRWSRTPAPYRLQTRSDQPATIVWVRLDSREFAKAQPGRPPRLNASLKDRTGVQTDLEQQPQSLIHYRRGFAVVGWLLPGPIESHQEGLLRVESTNGTEVVTFRVR